jgi:hypothetical protein
MRILGEPPAFGGRRAIRSITFAHFMRSVVPLLSLSRASRLGSRYQVLDNANNGLNGFLCLFTPQVKTCG